MRLFAVAFDEPSGSRGRLPVGDVGVLFGPNDAGKTRSLSALRDALESGPPEGITLWMSATGREMDALLRGNLFDPRPTVWTMNIPEAAQWRLRRQLESLGFPDPPEFGPIDLDSTEPLLGQWLRFLQGTLDAPGFGADVSLDDDAEHILMVRPQTSLRPNERGAEVMVGSGEGDAFTPMLPVWCSARAILPELMTIPADATTVRRSVEGAISRAVYLLGAAPDEEILSLDEVVEASLWTEEDATGTSKKVRSLVFTMCGVLDRACGALLHRFVGPAQTLEPEYAFDIRVLPLDKWGRDGRISIGLKPLRRDGDRFLLEDLAAGYQLWAQLAVLETARAATLFVGGLEDERECVSDSFDALGWPWPEDYEELPGWAAYQARCEVLLSGAFLGARSASRQSALVPRLYLIDEPERHLHPRIQRFAADFLAQEMRERGSQAIVATHSAHFLTDRNGWRRGYVSRTGRGPLIQPLDAEQLTAMSSFAEEMGFDHGELLVGVKLFLFVEGKADVAVLEALFNERLRSAGIKVVPLHGSRHARGAVELEALASFTTAPLAVLVDDLSLNAKLALLQRDSDARLDAIRNGKGGVKLLAAVIQGAIEVERPVEPLGIPGRDIFDELDEDVLGELFSFPGHAAANEAFSKISGKGTNEARKKFYSREYSVPDNVDTYSRVASEMKRRDLVPASLERILRRLETLAGTW